MAASNNFSEYYKTISNTELLSILDNPDEYQSSAVEAMWLLYESVTWKSPGFAGFDNLFSRPSPTIHIIQLLFLAGTIYVLCKPSIREVYSIDRIRMRASIGFTFIVTIVILFAIT